MHTQYTRRKQCLPNPTYLYYFCFLLSICDTELETPFPIGYIKNTGKLQSDKVLSIHQENVSELCYDIRARERDLCTSNLTTARVALVEVCICHSCIPTSAFVFNMGELSGHSVARFIECDRCSTWAVKLRAKLWKCSCSVTASAASPQSDRYPHRVPPLIARNSMSKKRRKNHGKFLNTTSGIE